uniref:DNA-binding protein n=1 Tax=Serratia phage Kevin TaxID=3161161 RepID=A0AAU8KYW0_9CAUD
MSRAKLVDQIAADNGISKTAADAVVRQFLAGVTSVLKTGEKVQLTGWGTFESKRTEARTGRNPQTGAAITIEAKNKVSFKPGESLKAAVNE